MVKYFYNKLTRINLAHFLAQFVWLGVFVATLPEQVSTAELTWRLCISYVAFNILTFGIRYIVVEKAVGEARRRMQAADSSVERMIDFLDQLSDYAHFHNESMKRIAKTSPEKPLLDLSAEADEMSLHLDKTTSDLEAIKEHLRILRIDERKLTVEEKRRMRQFESTYYFR